MMENTSEFTLPATSADATRPITTTEHLSETAKTTVVVLGIIINLFGIVGSTSILVIIRINTSLRKPYNLFLFSMALNDLCLCGVLNIIQVAAIHLREFPFSWPSQGILCRLHNIVWFHFLHVSLLHIAVIAVHRYLLIFRRHLVAYIDTKAKIRMLVLFLHVFSLIVFCTQKLSGEHRFIEAVGTCIPWSSGKISMALSGSHIALCTLTLLVCYISIHQKATRISNQVQTEITEGQASNSSRNYLKRMSAHKKILQCMFVIILLSGVSYLPMIISIARLIKASFVPPSLLSSTTIMVMVSNAANSVVYGILDINFRTAYREIHLCWPHCKRALRSNRLYPVIQ